MSSRKLFFSSLLFLLALTAKAQTTSFLHYGVENGLAQSQVQTVVQDNDANLWIGTMAGLSRYNGQGFTTYTRANGLAEDWITTSYKDKKGNIWFGHWGGGISLYTHANKKFASLKAEQITGFKTVTAITEDKEGNIWAGTDGSGIIRINAQTLEAKQAGPGKEEIQNVLSLAADEAGNLWIGTRNGAMMIDPSAINTARPWLFSINYDNRLSGKKITAVAPSSTDEVWIGTADSGIYVIAVQPKDNSSSVSYSLKKHITSADGLGSDNIQVIYHDSGSTWIGTRYGGVSRYGNGTFKTYSTRHGLNYYNINAVFRDRESNIWIGTDLGLNQYRGDRFQIFDESDGLLNNIVWAITADRTNNIWVGTNAGLSLLTLSGGAYNVSSLLHNMAILSLYEDNKGIIWIGTASNGVYRYFPSTGTTEKLPGDNIIAGGTVFSIAADNDGKIWLGTREGATKYDPETSSYLNITEDEGLGGSNVYRIFSDSKGRLWFGALGGYLTMYDGGRFKVFKEEDGINHRFILCINEDNAGNLWFGAYGGGLYKYNGSGFTNFSGKNGMKSESPYSIIADEENNLWIGTASGIEKLNTATGKFTWYGRQDGFLGLEANANAITKDNNKNIWLGTIMGAVKFNPSEDKINTNEPVTLINGLRIFLKDTLFPEGAEFNYDENHLTFKYTGISLTNPEKVVYQYKLEGFDEEWSPVTSSTEAVYANIPPGTYSFLVKSSNSDGLWNKNPAEYEFSIAPPFWKTTGFKALVLGVVLAVFLLIMKLRTRSLRQAKKMLEQKVQDRTLELDNKNRELARKNKEVTDSINYARRIQDAILPNPRVIRKSLPESFIFYKPKDIVSGDFYFFTTKNGKIILATVDCTGHGVPGALMSMIGNSFLNEIVNEMGITSPSEILLQLHKKVTSALSNEDNTGPADGMDLGIISIDPAKNEIVFSGAVRPLYYFSNDLFRVIEGDRGSVGGIKDIQGVEFRNHIVKAGPQDDFYLFTDGYADQFGGEKGKKFMTQRLKQLLQEIHGLPMEEQKSRIEAAFEEWKDRHEQVDDVLVVGFRPVKV